MTIHKFNNGELIMTTDIPTNYDPKASRTKVPATSEWIITVGNDNFLANWSYAQVADEAPTGIAFILTSNIEEAIRMSETEAQTLIDDIVAFDGRTDLGMQEVSDLDNDGLADSVVTLDATKYYCVMTAAHEYLVSSEVSAEDAIDVTSNLQDATSFTNARAVELVNANKYLIGVIETPADTKANNSA